MKIGIITGASSGIGKAFATQLQKEFSLDEIWLIARRKGNLAETASELETVKGISVPMDLTSKEDMDILKMKLEDTSPEIQFLVNSAGYGRIGTFYDVPAEDHLDMIDLNVKALVALTHICLPYMSQSSVIFQVASLSAFMPSPNGAVYAASKAFVLNFAYALYQDLKAKGIHVLAVSPGPVDTEFFEIASKGKSKSSTGMTKAADVVRQAIKDAKAKELNSTFGMAPKANILLSKVLSKKTLLRLMSK